MYLPTLVHGYLLGWLKTNLRRLIFVRCWGKSFGSFSSGDLLLDIDLLAREGTPDTIIIISSDSEDEDDQAVGLVTRFFLNGAGRPPTVREAVDFLPLARRNPGVLEEMNDHFHDELMRRSRAQQRVIRLEARVRDLVHEREEMVRETAKLERILAQSEAENEELRRQGAREDSPSNQELRLKLRVLRARVANRDVKIKELEKEVAKRALIDPRIEELGNELLRKHEELMRWRDHSINMRATFAPRVFHIHPREPSRSRNRVTSVDSGRGSAEPAAGPSAGASFTVGLPPHTIRSMLAAQGSESDDDITLIAEVPPLIGSDGQPVRPQPRRRRSTAAAPAAAEGTATEQVQSGEEAVNSPATDIKKEKNN